jgi:hypothetical protein
MKSLLPAVFTLFFWGNITAQHKNEWGFEYRQKLGFLAAHRGTMGHIPAGHAFVGELSFFTQTKGKKQWHKACKYPIVGATLFGGSVGNNKILGTYWGCYSFIEFPFVKRKHYEFLGKAGAGLGVGTRIFDQELNPKNDAISTHLNALICLGLKNHFLVGDNKISIGLDMTHFSNGSFKVPNLGINLPFVSIGYARTIQKRDFSTESQANTLPFKKWLFGATAIGSVKEIYPTGGKKYPIFALSIHARRFAKPKVGIETALDIISKQSITGYKSIIKKTQWDILQVGFYTGYLLPLDRFHFVLGMGVYLKDKYQPDDFLYHRVGFRYYLKNGITIQTVLKSHWAKADYVEWGVGYTFNYTNK